MKKNIYLTLILLAFVSAGSLMAQRPGSAFKGTINYKITTPDAKSDDQQTGTPQAMKVLLNGNKARIELMMGTISQIVLLDADAQTTMLLLDLMGQKVAMKPKGAEGRPAGKEPIVETKPETKEIAGYLCKKAEIHYGDERSKANPIIVYYTDQIGNNKIFYDNEYRNLPGIPMEFNYKMQGMNMYMIATSVEKGKVSNRDFEVPSEYKETTPEELRQMFGGN